MSRLSLATLALLATATAARAQERRPAPTPTPPTQTPAQAEAAKQRAADSARAAAARPAPAPAAPAAAAPAQVASNAAPGGVQAPTDTALPPVQTIGWIRAGQTRNGVLENNDFRMGDNTWADVWYFDGTAGQSVVIVATPRNFDGYVQLLDPAGNVLAQGNHSGSLREARIAFTLTAAGRYQIVVNNEGSDVKTGPYTLQLR